MKKIQRVGTRANSVKWVSHSCFTYSRSRVCLFPDGLGYVSCNTDMATFFDETVFAVSQNFRSSANSLPSNELFAASLLGLQPR